MLLWRYANTVPRASRMLAVLTASLAWGALSEELAGFYSPVFGCKRRICDSLAVCRHFLIYSGIGGAWGSILLTLSWKQKVRADVGRCLLPVVVVSRG